MRNFLIVFSLFFGATTFAQNASVNGVIGDTSWYETYGQFPSMQDNEELRIVAHLEYTVDRLKNRANENMELNISRRKLCIQLLEDYIVQKAFPSNYKFEDERRPCFIDPKGNICAVGYLLEKTSSREEAERINSLYQYHYLKDMKDTALLAWQQSSGLSMRELEMIQPAYDFQGPEPDMSHVKVRKFQDEKTGKFGLRSKRTDAIKLQPQYDQIDLGVLPSGLGWVLEDGKFGLVSRKGRVLIYPKYERLLSLRDFNVNHFYSADYFHGLHGTTLEVLNGSAKMVQSIIRVEEIRQDNDYLFFMKDGKWGAMNAEGKIITAPKYEEIHDPHYSRLMVKGENGYGLISIAGDTIIPLQYKWVNRVKKFWKASAEGFVEIYDEDGRKGEVGKLEEISSFGNSFYDHELIAKRKGKSGLLSASMTWKLEPKFDHIQKFLDYIIVKKGDKTGYYHYHSGLVFLKPQYQSIRAFRDRFVVKRNDKVGLLSKQGEVLIPLKQDSIAFLTSTGSGYKNFILAMRKDEDWRIVDMNGKLLYGGIAFENLESLTENVFMAKWEGHYHFGIFERGKLRIDSIHDFVSWKYNPYQKVVIYELEEGFGLWHIGSTYNFSLRKETKPVYEEVEYFGYGQGYLVKKNGKYGVLGPDRKVTFNYQYSDYRILDQKAKYIFLKDEKGWHKAFLTGTTMFFGNSVPQLDQRSQVQIKKTKEIIESPHPDP